MTLISLKRQVATAVLAVLLVGTAGSARADAGGQPNPPVSSVPAQTVPGPAASEESLLGQSDYAQREAQVPQIADFKGGSVGVYIGGSTLAVVLLVVLLVILI
ncbi:MAG TPA: hypothetical protein VH374_10365 [Polyangia bacterium]|jgi:hypothetical protein|nr:hypothetical protein [Polyangia bacterium]